LKGGDYNVVALGNMLVVWFKSTLPKILFKEEDLKNVQKNM